MTQLPPRLAERTPLDWREVMLRRLAAQAQWADVYESFYDGRHPLQFATTKFREAFANLFNAFADNWCQIVVDASVERLTIVGFEIGGNPNEQAWEIWQRNALDVGSMIAHTEAGKCGRAFLLVDPSEDVPRITVEHPTQMVVAVDPGDTRKRLAALKRWAGDDGYQYVTLYLPDVVMKWESDGPVRSEGQTIEWVERSDGPALVPNPLDVVPVIPLENNPGLLGTYIGDGQRLDTAGHSDLEPAIPMQNAVNKLCTDMIVNSEFGAFQQRFVTGVDVPKDPETGQPTSATELKAAQSRLWAFDKTQVTVGSLPATDMNNFVVSIEMLIQHLAAQTRTPPHYLLAKMVNASGDALATAEAGLVEKCKKKILCFSDAWEEALALALTASGTETEAFACQSMWKNPERISQSALADAMVKKKSLDVPIEQIWLELGYTPEKIAEMVKLAASAAEQELERELLLQEAQARVTIAATPEGEAVNPPGGTPAQPPPQGSSPGPAEETPKGG